MNLQELEKRVQEQQRVDLALILRKSHDYSGPDDCIRNISDYGFLGILVRLSDKLSRIKNIYKSAASVDDETVMDTLMDIRNYAHLGQVIYEEEKK